MKLFGVVAREDGETIIDPNEPFRTLSWCLDSSFFIGDEVVVMSIAEFYDELRAAANGEDAPR